MADTNLSDDVAIDKIMQSENLRKLIKILVKEEIKSRGDEGNTIQKLSDLLSQVTSGHNVSSELTKQSSGPVIPINDLRGDEGIGYTQEEKRIRCQLASLYRLMDLHGWTLNIYNHITVRINSETDEFFINPMGLLYREITASSLVKINIKGQTLDSGSSVFGINKAGWSLHAALHSSRPDIHCIIHTHVPDVIAVSCLKYGLLPISPEAVELLDESVDSISRGVRYHDYWGLAITKEEWPSLKEDIGPYSKILFLRNHGVAVCGNNCIEAWILLKRVINACENQVRLLQTKGEDGLLAMNSINYEKPNEQVENEEESSLKSHRITSAELEFEAMMRMLDNAGYRTGYSYCHGNLLRKGCGINFNNDEIPLDSTLANVTDLNSESSNVNGGNPNKLSHKALASRQKAAQRNQWLIKTMSPDESIQEESKNILRHLHIGKLTKWDDSDTLKASLETLQSDIRYLCSSNSDSIHTSNSTPKP